MKEYTIEELKHMLKDMQEIIPTLTLKDLQALYPVKKSSADSEEDSSKPVSKDNSSESKKDINEKATETPPTSSEAPKEEKTPKTGLLPTTTTKLTIVASSDNEVQQEALRFTTTLYKGELTSFVRPFFEGWKNGDISVVWDDGTEYTISSKLAATKATQFGTSLTKDMLASYSSMLFESRENFKAYISMFSEHAWDEYIRIAHAGCVILKKSKDIVTGEKFTVDTNPSFKAPYSLIPYDKVYSWQSEDERVYHIPSPLALKLLEWDDPSVTNEEIKYVTPDLDRYQTFCGTDIANLLYTIKMLNFTGALSFGATNTLNTSGKRVLAATAHCLEPLAGYDDSNFHDWRKNMVATYFLLIGGSNAKGVSRPSTLLKALFKKLSYAINETKAGYQLPQFTKIFKKDINNEALNYCLNTTLGMLKKCSIDQWVSIKYLYNKFIYKCYRDDNAGYIFDSKSYRPLDITNIFTKEVVKQYDYRSKIDYPFFCGLFMTLAAFGIVEVAFKPSGDDDSFFGEVDYFKMTPLANLIFDRVITYSFPPIDTFTLTLEPNSLIIKDNSQHNVYRNYLLTIARPIGGPRYIVDQTSFCNGLRTAYELENTIDKFKNIVDTELPDNWKEFFEELEAKSKAVRQGAPKSYHIYTLDPSFRDLLQWLSTDPEIRKISLRVEGCYLLVEADHIVEFENRLAKEGYFL